MKRTTSGWVAGLALVAVFGAAACLRTFAAPEANHPSGSYPSELTVAIAGVKPADCYALFLEVRSGGQMVDLAYVVGDQQQVVPSIAFSVTTSTTVEVLMKPGPGCWTYAEKNVTFEYRLPAPQPPADMTPPEDMTAPPDLMPPPDLTPLPDLTPPPDMVDPCFNGVQDGDETDVDCGGPVGQCPTRCVNGQSCMMSSDCNTGIGLACFNDTCIFS